MSWSADSAPPTGARSPSTAPRARRWWSFVRFDVFDFTAILARGEPLWKPPRYIAFILRAGEPDQARLVDLGEASRSIG